MWLPSPRTAACDCTDTECYLTPGAPVPKQGDWHPAEVRAPTTSYTSNQGDDSFQKLFLLSKLPDLFIQQTCTKHLLQAWFWEKHRKAKNKSPCHQGTHGTVEETRLDQTHNHNYTAVDLSRGVAPS